MKLDKNELKVLSNVVEDYPEARAALAKINCPEPDPTLSWLYHEDIVVMSEKDFNNLYPRAYEYDKIKGNMQFFNIPNMNFILTKDEKYITVCNITRHCWVEEFPSFEKAVQDLVNKKY